MRIVECVPNYSEGRNKRVIDGIVDAIREARVETEHGAEGVKVLHVDSGEAANRTVVTFAGSPEAVIEAAFQGSKAASELIDMRVQKGEHPRTGAIDVLPIVPVSGISLEECAEMARNLARRMFTEIGIPCNCYEASAFRPERRKLEACRVGEYEALPERIANPDTRPDFSPSEYNETVARTGASNVGARKFLIAVNFNLDTTDAGIAGEIAADVRESGRVLKDADGNTVRNSDGKAARRHGPLKGCKAIGWYIEEYGIAQVSVNITDMDLSPLHIVFETISRTALNYGVHVTGTEIIGLVPERALLEAGEHFLNNSQALAAEKIQEAIRRMNLSDLRPFLPDEKVLEYKL